MAEETVEKEFIENPEQVLRQESLRTELESLTPAEDADIEPEADDEAASEADPEGETSQNGTSSKPKGDDEILKQLDETNPEAAKAMRALITDSKKNRIEQKDIARLVKEEVEAQKPKEEPGVPDGYKSKDDYDADLEAFRKLGKTLGFVTEEDQQAKEQLTAAEQHAFNLNKAAVESYGDVFGEIQGNTFTPNEDIKDDLIGELDRLEDPKRGVAFADLYTLKNHEKIVEDTREKAYNEGLEAGRTGKEARTEKRKKAIVETGSSATQSVERTPLRLRGKEGEDDSPNSVMMRAFLDAKKEIG